MRHERRAGHHKYSSERRLMSGSTCTMRVRVVRVRLGVLARRLFTTAPLPLPERCPPRAPAHCASRRYSRYPTRPYRLLPPPCGRGLLESLRRRRRPTPSASCITVAHIDTRTPIDDDAQGTEHPCRRTTRDASLNTHILLSLHRRRIRYNPHLPSCYQRSHDFHQTAILPSHPQTSPVAPSSPSIPAVLRCAARDGLASTPTVPLFLRPQLPAAGACPTHLAQHIRRHPGEQIGVRPPQ